jgi:hypothetical protein
VNSSEEKQAVNFKRRPIWYLKWVFACYAAAFGLFLFIFLVSMPFAGNAFADWWFKPSGSVAMFATAIATSPFIYRWLR